MLYMLCFLHDLFAFASSLSNKNLWGIYSRTNSSLCELRLHTYRVCCCQDALAACYSWWQTGGCGLCDPGSGLADWSCLNHVYHITYCPGVP